MRLRSSRGLLRSRALGRGDRRRSASDRRGRGARVSPRRRSFVVRPPTDRLRARPPRSGRAGVPALRRPPRPRGSFAVCPHHLDGGPPPLRSLRARATIRPRGRGTSRLVRLRPRRAELAVRGRDGSRLVARCWRARRGGTRARPDAGESRAPVTFAARPVRPRRFCAPASCCFAGRKVPSGKPNALSISSETTLRGGARRRSTCWRLPVERARRSCARRQPSTSGSGSAVEFARACLVCTVAAR